MPNYIMTFLHGLGQLETLKFPKKASVFPQIYAKQTVGKLAKMATQKISFKILIYIKLMIIDLCNIDDHKKLRLDVVI